MSPISAFVWNGHTCWIRVHRGAVLSSSSHSAGNVNSWLTTASTSTAALQFVYLLICNGSSRLHRHRMTRLTLSWFTSQTTCHPVPRTAEKGRRTEQTEGHWTLVFSSGKQQRYQPCRVVTTIPSRNRCPSPDIVRYNYTESLCRTFVSSLLCTLPLIFVLVVL